MFLTLLSKEIREHLLTFRFGAALITIVLLSIISTWILGDNYIIRKSTATRLADSYLQQAREVRFPSQILPNVQRPPTPLSIIAQGEDYRLGNTVQVRRRSVPHEADDNLTKNRLLASIPSFDMMLVLMFSVSLFGILLSYDGFSGDRERGTLKMVCSFALKRSGIFASKFFAGSIVLSIPILISFIASLMVMLFFHQITFSAIQWAAIVVMLLTAILYGMLFITAGLLSSVLVIRSSTSLAIALLFWTLVVVVIPSGSNFLAPLLKPAYSPEEINSKLQASSLELMQQREEFIRTHNISFSSNGGDWEGAEGLWWFDGYPSWLEDWKTFFIFYEPLCQRYAENNWYLRRKHLARKIEQRELSFAVNFVSPAFHLQRAYTALTVTGYESHAEFMEKCRQYRHTLLNTFAQKGLFGKNAHRFFTRWELSDFERPEQYEQRLAERRAKGIWGPQIWDPLPEDYVPPFNYESGKPNIEDALWHIVVLLFMTLIAFSAGFVIFFRYDVR